MASRLACALPGQGLFSYLNIPGPTQLVLLNTWHTPHVLSAGTSIQEAPAIPNEVSLMHYICGIQNRGFFYTFFAWSQDLLLILF